MSPKGELGLMPPYHFHMGASVPRIISKTRLLGRIATATVYGKKILAEHDPPLQFRGPGVGAMAEIHYPSFVPELVPILLGCIARSGNIGTLHTQRAFKAELGAERPAIRLRHKAYRIPSAPAQTGTLIAQLHIVAALIQAVAKKRDSAPVAEDFHLMQLIPGPVNSVIGVRSGRIRETQGNRSMRRVIDAESKHITHGIAGRKHLDLSAFILKAAAEHAVIHIQRLVNTLQRGSLKTLKTNDSQMESVGIDTEIVRCALTAGVLELAGIDLFVAVTEIKRLQILFRTVILRIEERMPAPVGHSPERHSLGIKLREALKTGHIGGIGKMAVAHRKRGKSIDSGQMGIIALHKRRAVYLLSAADEKNQSQRVQ